MNPAVLQPCIGWLANANPQEKPYTLTQQIKVETQWIISGQKVKLLLQKLSTLCLDVSNVTGFE